MSQPTRPRARRFTFPLYLHRVPVHIEYTSALKDYLCAQRLHSKRSLWWRFASVGIRFVGPTLGFLILAFALLLYNPGSLRSGSYQLMVGCALVLILHPLYIRHRMKSCYRRTRIGNGTRTIDFDEQTIKTREGATRSEFDWSAIKFIREDKNVMMLYLAPAKFLLIPKRCCTPQDLENMRRLFQEAANARTKTPA